MKNRDYDRESSYDPRYGGRRESGMPYEDDFDREYQERFPGRSDRFAESNNPNRGRYGRGEGSAFGASYGSQFGGAGSSFGGGSGSYGGNYGSANYGGSGSSYGSGAMGQQGYGSRFEGGSQGSIGSQGQGQFAGKGPKGYRRTDERIVEDISERLSDHPDVDASEIEVRVENGIAILTGSVSDRHCKRMAEDVASSVSGVQDVRNEIRVQSNSHSEGDSLSRGMRKESQMESGRTETAASGSKRS